MEYGLIGETLKHSFSKQIHEEIHDYVYKIKEIAKGDLASFMSTKNFKGINVTIPYKESVIPFLDELDESAKEVGAVNTIKKVNDKLIGYNTDVFGFIAELEHLNIDVKNKTVLILGTGGACKAIYASLKRLNAKNMLIASRQNVEGNISYDEIYSHQEIEIIINTTPVGMYPNNENKLIDLSRFSLLEAFVDLIYNPLATSLVLEAKKLGLKTGNGLYMLVAQAINANAIFMDKEIDKTLIDKIYEKIYQKKRNIVLIGMPSSGKSTIGRNLAKYLNRKFIDIDKLIVKKEEMSIKDYFTKYGEEEFRELESKTVKEIYKEQSLVIAPGGGIILRENNIDLLKQNGLIIYLKRDLDKLICTKSRPLSNNKEKLEKVYESRKDLYIKYADIVVDNNDDIDTTLERIKVIL